jgi:hypothetical protein
MVMHVLGATTITSVWVHATMSAVTYKVKKNHTMQ